MIGGLVEHDDLRLLHNHPGNTGLLPLAAGDFRVGPVRQKADIHSIQHLVHQSKVYLRWLLEHAKIRCPAHDHKIPHGIAVGRGMGLGHIADDFRNVLQFNLPDVLSLQQYTAGGRAQEVGQAVEKRGFSRTVGPQNGENLPLVQAEIHILENCPAAVVGKAQIFHFQNHAIFILCFTRMYR